MPSTEAPHEYVTHNFTAVNDHVDELTRRAYVVTSARRAEVFATYAKYGSLLAICLGIAGWLLFLGISTLTNPQPEVIEKDVVVEKTVSFKPNIYVTTSEGGSFALDATRDAAKQVIAKVLSEGAEQTSTSPVYDFVIFRDIPFVQDGFSHVNVGMRYDDTEATMPSSQWCYIERLQLNQTSQKITLALKTEGDQTNIPMTTDIATSLLTSLDVLKAAQKSCIFR